MSFMHLIALVNDEKQVHLTEADLN